MKVKKSDAAKVFQALQFQNHAKWDVEKMTEKANALGDIVDKEMLKTVKDKAVAELLTTMLKAIKKGTEIEILDDAKAGKKAEKVSTKPGKKAKVVEEDEEEDDVEDEDEEESEEEDDDAGDDEENEDDDSEAEESDEDEDEDVTEEEDEDDEEEEEESEDEEEEEEPAPKKGKKKRVVIEEEEEEDDTEDEDSDDDEEESEDEDEEPEDESDEDEEESEDDEDEEDEDVEEAPAKKKGQVKKPTKPEKKDSGKKGKPFGRYKDAERDKWGFSVGTRTARVNAVFNEKPKTVSDIEKEAKAISIGSHISKLSRLGLIEKIEGKGWVLSKKGGGKGSQVKKAEAPAKKAPGKVEKNGKKVPVAAGKKPGKK